MSAGSRLTQLVLQDWRCHRELELQPDGAAWVVLSGGNGAGKTSVLEALYAAARGRSFRSNSLAAGIRTGSGEARVVARTDGETRHVLGLAVRRDGRELRLDGNAEPGLARIAQAVPVEYISGDAYRLVAGAPGIRRRFLDWALFHVEPSFLETWQAWHRAHRQRNALLRQGIGGSELAYWTPAVAEFGARITAMRRALVERLNGRLAAAPADWNLGNVGLGFRPGWKGESLAEALHRAAGRELQAGRAVVGPQYDDWRVTVGVLGSGQLSRGQAKLAGLFLYCAQSLLLGESGRRPILLVDDLAADLDRRAVQAAIGLLAGAGAQAWLSVLPEDGALVLPGEAARFHVEPAGPGGA